MYRTIIVPLDGSARSHMALPVAARLARASGAQLELVRVHVNERPDLADDPAWDEMFRDGELRYLESLASAYESSPGCPASYALLDAPVMESLVDLVNSRVAPLVVIAGHGRTGLRRVLLGSTADGLVRSGAGPVLVLRDGPDDDGAPLWRMRRDPFARIVLPLDGTAHAEGSIAHGVAMAKACGAKLHLLRVVGPVISSAVLGEFAMFPLAMLNEATEARSDLARDYLQGIVDRIQATSPTLDISTEAMLSFDPATAIVETTRRHAADLVVMATHGRGASRLLLGAVGDRVLRDGPNAILFVRPPSASMPAGLSFRNPYAKPERRVAVPARVH